MKLTVGSTKIYKHSVLKKISVLVLLAHRRAFKLNQPAGDGNRLHGDDPLGSDSLRDSEDGLADFNDLSSGRSIVGGTNFWSSVACASRCGFDRFFITNGNDLGNFCGFWSFVVCLGSLDLNDGLFSDLDKLFNWLRLLSEFHNLDGLGQGCCRWDQEWLGSCQGQGLEEQLPVLALATSDSHDSSRLIDGGLTFDDAGLGEGHIDGGKGQEKGEL